MKNNQILKSLLKEHGNNRCADCKTSQHPRWASWNLGIFICIRCSGIHRSMGTHISRVKSVDLDTWTEEQTQSMIRLGNDKANAYWEAGLPDNYVPDDSKIDNFIRTKYELKKWVGKAKPAAPAQQHPQTQQHHQHQHPQQQAQSRSKTNTLLDLEFGTPVSAPKPQPQHQSALQSLSAPASQTNLPSTGSSAGARAANDRPDLKKSILSLYSTPSNSSPLFQQPSVSSVNSGSSLNSFNSFNSVKPVASQPQSQPTWNPNDELFKNVWD